MKKCSHLAPRDDFRSQSERTTLFRQTDPLPNKSHLLLLATSSVRLCILMYINDPSLGAECSANEAVALCIRAIMREVLELCANNRLVLPRGHTKGCPLVSPSEDCHISQSEITVFNPSTLHASVAAVAVADAIPSIDQARHIAAQVLDRIVRRSLIYLSDSGGLGIGKWGWREFSF
jgi:hypothetical protein